MWFLVSYRNNTLWSILDLKKVKLKPWENGVISHIFKPEHLWQPGAGDAETDNSIEALAEAVSDGVPW